VKCDAIELRCTHAADETDAVQSGQRTVIDLDALAVPTHTQFERLFDWMSTPGVRYQGPQSATHLIDNLPGQALDRNTRGDDHWCPGERWDQQ
jgi:hypothetical protein